jgi:1,3-beta-glucanosyltransferase GAS1
MRNAGINTIRVGALLPERNHDGCMEAFASREIYVWIEGLYITSPQYTTYQEDGWVIKVFDHIATIIDQFAVHNNTLTIAAPTERAEAMNSTKPIFTYTKAAIRDMKKYISERGYRQIPIAFSSDNETPDQPAVADYLECGEPENALEVLGLDTTKSIYCSQTSRTTELYETLYDQFRDTNIPIIFTDVGCYFNQTSDTWDNIDRILGPTLSSVFSGAFTSRWTSWDPDSVGYMLVDYASEEDLGQPSPLPQWNKLSSAYAEATPLSVAQASYTPSSSVPECPNPDGGWWSIEPDAVLPTVGALSIEDYVQSSDPSTAPSSTADADLSSNVEGDSSSDSDPAPASASATMDASLTTGAKAGIGVGVSIAVLLALGMLAFFLTCRKRRKRDNAAEAGPIAHEKDSLMVSASPAPVEKDSTVVSPMTVTHELPAEIYPAPAELSGSSVSDRTFDRRYLREI